MYQPEPDRARESARKEELASEQGHLLAETLADTDRVALKTQGPLAPPERRRGYLHDDDDDDDDGDDDEDDDMKDVDNADKASRRPLQQQQQQQQQRRRRRRRRRRQRQRLGEAVGTRSPVAAGDNGAGSQQRSKIPIRARPMRKVAKRREHARPMRTGQGQGATDRRSPHDGRTNAGMHSIDALKQLLLMTFVRAFAMEEWWHRQSNSQHQHQQHHRRQEHQQFPNTREPDKKGSPSLAFAATTPSQAAQPPPPVHPDHYRHHQHQQQASEVQHPLPLPGGIANEFQPAAHPQTAVPTFPMSFGLQQDQPLLSLPSPFQATTATTAAATMMPVPAASELPFNAWGPYQYATVPETASQAPLLLPPPTAPATTLETSPTHWMGSTSTFAGQAVPHATGIDSATFQRCLQPLVDCLALLQSIVNDHTFREFGGETPSAATIALVAAAIPYGQKDVCPTALVLRRAHLLDLRKVDRDMIMEAREVVARIPASDAFMHVTLLSAFVAAARSSQRQGQIVSDAIKRALDRCGEEAVKQWLRQHRLEALANFHLRYTPSTGKHQLHFEPAFATIWRDLQEGPLLNVLCKATESCLRLPRHQQPP